MLSLVKMQRKMVALDNRNIWFSLKDGNENTNFKQETNSLGSAIKMIDLWEDFCVSGSHGLAGAKYHNSVRSGRLLGIIACESELFYRGKHYSVNVPLKNGMTDEAYSQLFQPVLSKVMQVYQPEAIVFQSGQFSSLKMALSE